MKKIIVVLALFFSLFFLSTSHAIAQTIVVVTPTPAVQPAVVVTLIPTPTPCVNPAGETAPCVQVNERELGFQIPTLSRILTFTIRMFFILAGLAALVMLLLGAFSWITSGGDKDKVHAAQSKIQAAVLGLIMIVVVLALVVTLEQVVFAGRLCFGLSCPITIPSLLKDPNAAPDNTNASFQLLDDTPTPPTVLVTATPTPIPGAPGTQLQLQQGSSPNSNGNGQVPQVPNSGMAQ